jgi:hypothetical protein
MEFTRPRHDNTQAAPQDIRLMRGTLARVGWNDLLGGAGKRGILAPPVMRSVAFSVLVLTHRSDAQNGFPLFR